MYCQLNLGCLGRVVLSKLLFGANQQLQLELLLISWLCRVSDSIAVANGSSCSRFFCRQLCSFHSTACLTVAPNLFLCSRSAHRQWAQNCSSWQPWYSYQQWKLFFNNNNCSCLLSLPWSALQLQSLALFLNLQNCSTLLPATRLSYLECNSEGNCHLQATFMLLSV